MRARTHGGDLSRILKEVTSADVFDYGFGREDDFLKSKIAAESFDWVITNPPFRLAEDFIQKGLGIARRGVAMLTRTVFVESVGRYERLFQSKARRTLKAYEIKRGAGLHDSGKRRSMLRDTLCVQILLKSCGKERGHSCENAFSHIIFYYGKCSIPKPFGITGAELDEHFGFEIHAEVEDVNKYFQGRLFSILAGAR